MLVANQGWRLMMMMGALPAVLTFFFRIFVPESAKWKHEQSQGTTSHWVASDLLGVVVGAIGPGLIVWVWADSTMTAAPRVLGTLVGLVLAAGGYIYPVWRFLQRTNGNSPEGQQETGRTIRRMLLAAMLSGVALIGTWGSTQWAMTWAGQLTQDVKQTKSADLRRTDQGWRGCRWSFLCGTVSSGDLEKPARVHTDFYVRRSDGRHNSGRDAR